MFLQGTAESSLWRGGATPSTKWPLHCHMSVHYAVRAMMFLSSHIEENNVLYTIQLMSAAPLANYMVWWFMCLTNRCIVQQVLYRRIETSPTALSYTQSSVFRKLCAGVSIMLLW